LYLVVAAIAGPSLGVLAFIYVVLWPALEQTAAFTKARMITEQRVPSEGSQVQGMAEHELRALLDAAGQIDKGKGGDGTRWLEWLPAVRKVNESSRAASTETAVLGELRKLLFSAAWVQQSAASGAPAVSAPRGMQPCELPGVDRPSGLIVKTLEPGLGFFVPEVSAQDNEVLVWAVALDSGTPTPDKPGCRAVDIALPLQTRHKPYLFFDQQGQILAIARTLPSPSVTLYAAKWAWDVVERRMRPRFDERRVIFDPRIDAVFATIGNPWDQSSFVPAALVGTRAIAGGLQVQLGSNAWNLLTSDAQPLGPTDWVPSQWDLARPVQVGACAELDPGVKEDLDKEEASAPEGRRNAAVQRQMMQVPGSDYCMAVVSYAGVTDPAAGGSPDARAELVAIRVYSLRALEASKGLHHEAKAKPMVTWAFTTQVPGTQREWWLGKELSPFEGWLASRATGPTSKDERPLASPFALGALQRLAERMLAQGAPVAPAAGSGVRKVP
jgi:hypothetical protein